MISVVKVTHQEHSRRSGNHGRSTKRLSWWSSGAPLGSSQWNGRSVRDRAQRFIGWEPVGIYERDTLACRPFLTSRWPINSKDVGLRRPGLHKRCIELGALTAGDIAVGAAVCEVPGGQRRRARWRARCQPTSRQALVDWPESCGLGDQAGAAASVPCQVCPSS